MQMKVYLHFKQWLEQTWPTTQAVFSDQTSWYHIPPILHYCSKVRNQFLKIYILFKKDIKLIKINVSWFLQKKY